MEFSFNQHSFINALLSDNSVLYRFYGVKRKIFNITQSLGLMIQFESRNLFQADYSDMFTVKNCFKHDKQRHLVPKKKNHFFLQKPGILLTASQQYFRVSINQSKFDFSAFLPLYIFLSQKTEVLKFFWVS